jgi:hypothetical protein
MIASAGPLKQKLFRYVRYNAELTRTGLSTLFIAACLNEGKARLEPFGTKITRRRFYAFVQPLVYTRRTAQSRSDAKSGQETSRGRVLHDV